MATNDGSAAPTVTSSGAGLRHGTPAAYKKHKCRCEACRAWRAEAARTERARKRPDVRGLVKTSDAWRLVGSQRVFNRLVAAGDIAPRASIGRARYWHPDDVGEALERDRVRQESARICAVGGCGGRTVARGLCQAHYNRIRYTKLGQKRPTQTPSYRASRHVAKGGTLNPPISLPYRHVARTCRQCGDLITTPPHLLRKDSGPLPQCPKCSVQRVVDYQRKRFKEDAEFREREMERRRVHGRRYIHKRQAETLPIARRNGTEWTGPELEIALREDLTVREIAKMLGRTYAAVAHARHRARHEPKFAALAGVPMDSVD